MKTRLLLLYRALADPASVIIVQCVVWNIRRVFWFDDIHAVRA